MQNGFNGRYRRDVRVVWVFTDLGQVFIARLVAAVPKPRVNVTRRCDVLAPNRKYSARLTPLNGAAAVGVRRTIGRRQYRGNGVPR